jgi:hypothetical protein
LAAAREDHCKAIGQILDHIPTEQGMMRTWWQDQLLAHLVPFADLRAGAFSSNPYVWFGTMNEPGGNSETAIAQQEQQIYNAIRGAGNNTIVMLEFQNGGSPQFAEDNPSYYATMTNVVWDAHN